MVIWFKPIFILLSMAWEMSFYNICIAISTWDYYSEIMWTSYIVTTLLIIVMITVWLINTDMNYLFISECPDDLVFQTWSKQLFLVVSFEVVNWLIRFYSMYLLNVVVVLLVLSPRPPPFFLSLILLIFIDAEFLDAEIFFI